MTSRTFFLSFSATFQILFILIILRIFFSFCFLLYLPSHGTVFPLRLVAIKLEYLEKRWKRNQELVQTYYDSPRALELRMRHSIEAPIECLSALFQHAILILGCIKLKCLNGLYDYGMLWKILWVLQSIKGSCKIKRWIVSKLKLAQNFCSSNLQAVRSFMLFVD